MSVVSKIPGDRVLRAGPRSTLIPRRMRCLGLFFLGRTAVFAVWISLLLCSLAEAVSDSERLAVLLKQYQQTQTRFVSDLEAVAITWDQAQLIDLAAEVRRVELPLEQQP